MKFGRKVKVTKERALLDESRLNGRKINPASSGFLLEAEGGLSRIEKCKADPDIPLYLTGVIQTGDKPNRNGRIYPWEFLKRECIRYMENEVKNGLSYGECFSEGHKILTKNEGWVDFKNLPEDAIVATMNPETKEFEWQQILRKVQYEYEGDMIPLKSKSIDTLVTPNHKFLIQKTINGVLEPCYAKDLKPKYRIPTKSVWKGNDNKTVIIKNKYGEKEFLTEEFFKFLGWYISEGWFAFNKKNGNYRVSISQSKESEVKEIRSLLDKLNLKYSETINDKRKNKEHTFNIQGKFLAEYCRQFGKSVDKYIPQIIKDSSPKYIESFLETYFKGDGWYINKKYRIFATISLKLAEDLLELFQKTNSFGKLSEREQYSTFYTIKNINTGEQKEVLDIVYYTHKKYVDNKENFKIIETRRSYSGTKLYIVSQKRKDSFMLKPCLRDKENYKGKVYCVETPNHTIYVMNNGLPFWSKQCDHPEDSATPSLTNAALIIEDLSFKGKDVVAKIRVLNAFMPDSAPGKKIRGFLLNGKNVGISSRTLGSLEQYTDTEYDVVAEDMEVVCWDFVSNASNFGSEKLNLVESNGSNLFPHKKSKLLFESELKDIKMLTESEKMYLEILGLERFIKARNILG